MLSALKNFDGIERSLRVCRLISKYVQTQKDIERRAYVETDGCKFGTQYGTAFRVDVFLSLQKNSCAIKMTFAAALKSEEYCARRVY